jgi:hypothetical protein
MKFVSASLVLTLFAALAIGVQKPSSNKPPTLGPEPGANAPTLGVGPSLHGPLTASIVDARMLRMVHKIYIGWIDNSLNTKLAQDLAKAGPFRVVSNKRDADAILQGSCFDSPHLREVHSEVYLSGRNGKPIWQDIIRKPYRPPSLAVAVNETATDIVAQLHASIQAAERR